MPDALDTDKLRKWSDDELFDYDERGEIIREKFLGCPCCGSEKIERRTGYSFQTIIANWNGTIVCLDCGASAPAVYWNNRAALPAAARRAENDKHE